MGLALTAFPLLVPAQAWDRFISSIVSHVLPPTSAQPSAFHDLLSMPLWGFRHFSYLVGTALCGCCGVRWLLHREKQLIPAEITILLFCNLYVVAQVLPLLARPDGERLRAMGADPLAFFIAIGLTAFGLTGGAADFCRLQPRAGFLTRNTLSLLPVPLLLLSYILISDFKGFLPR